MMIKVMFAFLMTGLVFIGIGLKHPAWKNAPSFFRRFWQVSDFSGGGLCNPLRALCGRI
jgi:hypothetical protein